MLQAYVERGRRFLRWMEGTDLESCPVRRSNLAFADFPETYTSDLDKYSLPDNMGESLARVGIDISVVPFHYEQVMPVLSDEGHNSWEGLVTAGAIVVNNIQRDYRGPHMSDVSLAVYREYYPQTPLRYLLVQCIVNDSTVTYFQGAISSPGQENYTLNYGSEQYLGVLGTDIGAMAACVVLGAFEPGTQRISRIDIQHSTELFITSCIDIQFFIEPVPSSSSPEGQESASSTTPMQTRNKRRRSPETTSEAESSRPEKRR